MRRKISTPLQIQLNQKPNDYDMIVFILLKVVEVFN